MQRKNGEFYKNVINNNGGLLSISGSVDRNASAQFEGR